MARSVLLAPDDHVAVAGIEFHQPRGTTGLLVIASKETRDQSELAPEFAGRIADIDPAGAGTASDAGDEQKLKSDHCAPKQGGNPSGNLGGNLGRRGYHPGYHPRSAQDPQESAIIRRLGVVTGDQVVTTQGYHP